MTASRRNPLLTLLFSVLLVCWPPFWPFVGHTHRWTPKDFKSTSESELRFGERHLTSLKAISSHDGPTTTEGPQKNSKKNAKRAQKVAIVDGVVAAAQAKPAIIGVLSTADCATALRKAVRKVLGKTCATNFLDNSFNLRDVAVALAQRLGNKKFTAQLISIYGESSVQAASSWNQ